MTMRQIFRKLAADKGWDVARIEKAMDAASMNVPNAQADQEIVAAEGMTKQETEDGLYELMDYFHNQMAARPEHAQQLCQFMDIIQSRVVARN